MSENSVVFDHIEVHVKDIPTYCEFLLKLFKGAGKYKVISDSGTSMFVTEGINIEVKKRKEGTLPMSSGFCNPCLRMENAKEFIEKTLELKITNRVTNLDGEVFFFTDHEGVTWHIKNYSKKDRFICFG